MGAIQPSRLLFRSLSLTALTGLAIGALAQATVSGDTVQANLLAAINSGAATFVLPDATILLTKPLDVPTYTRNFTIIGQTNTRIVRNYSSNSLPLMRIGDDDGSAINNMLLDAVYPWVTPSPVPDGASVLSVPVGASTPPGWYVLAGTDVQRVVGTTTTVGNDSVRNGLNTYHFKRELVRVVQQNGTAVTLSAPVGRPFETPRLYRLEVNNAPTADRRVVSNVRLINFSIDGRLGDRVIGRSPAIKAPLADFVILVSRSENITLDNVRVSGFSNSGIKIGLCRNVSVQNCQISDGRAGRGYGVEVTGSRFVNVSNTTFQDVGLAVMFQAGSMDGYVFNCSIPPGRGRFDVGHGQDERRITYENCRADEFVIGNQGWQRGGQWLSLINCTAFRQIVIYGNTRNVLIQGWHPSSSITAPLVTLNTEVNSNGDPSGPFGPVSVTLDNVRLNNQVWPGRPIQIVSNTIPESSLRSQIGNVLVRNSALTNPFTASSSLVLPNVQGTGTLRFENTTFATNAAGVFPIVAQSVTAGSSWDVTFATTAFTSPSPQLFQLLSGARGTFRFQGSSFNGGGIVPGLIQNGSGGSATVQITP